MGSYPIPASFLDTKAINVKRLICYKRNGRTVKRGRFPGLPDFERETCNRIPIHSINVSKGSSTMIKCLNYLVFNEEIISDSPIVHCCWILHESWFPISCNVSSRKIPLIMSPNISPGSNAVLTVVRKTTAEGQRVASHNSYNSYFWNYHDKDMLWLLGMIIHCKGLAIFGGACRLIPSVEN